MNIRHFSMGLMVAAVVFSGAALADEIYKWTDEDGNVHYEDRPSAAANQELLRLTYRRTNNSTVQNRVQTRLDSQADKRDAKESAMADAEAAAEKQAVEDENKRRCDGYRAKLESMAQSQRVYREDDNGERVYLDDAERQATREKAEDLINEHCNS